MDIANYNDFNSIKVQLKLNGISLNTQIVRFQFHKGTIKTGDLSRHNKYDDYFNSIKVQLKLPSDNQKRQ